MTVTSLSAQSAPSSNTTGSTADDTVVLTPFEVLADKKDSYEATNTASLTGINTSLQRVPITADIYNSALLDDLGVTDLNRFLGDFAGYGSPVTGLNQFGRGNGDGDVTYDEFKNSIGHLLAPGMNPPHVPNCSQPNQRSP